MWPNGHTTGDSGGCLLQHTGGRDAGDRVRGLCGGCAGALSRSRNNAVAPNAKNDEAPVSYGGSSPEKRNKVRETINDHGFVKLMSCRCRGDRYEPRDGDGFRRGRLRRPEKLAELSSEKFAGSEIQKFGDGSAGLRKAARESDGTSGTSASRATPAYI